MSKFLFLLCVCCVTLCLAYKVHGEESLPTTFPLSYQHYLSQGKEQLKDQDYEEAFLSFKKAHLIDPYEEEPLFYLNLIKRLLEGQVEFYEEFKPPKKPKKETIVRETLDEWERKKLGPPQEGPPALPKEEAGKEILPEKRIQVLEEPQILYLNEELWRLQPGMILRIVLNTSVILEGNNIERYLIITTRTTSQGTNSTKNKSSSLAIPIPRT